MIIDFIDEIGNKRIFFHHSQRFSVFFTLIKGHAIIDALFIFENEARSAGEATGSEQGKFFGIFWGIGPTLCWFDGGIADINSDVA